MVEMVMEADEGGGGRLERVRRCWMMFCEEALMDLEEEMKSLASFTIDLGFRERESAEF
ncbi:hypothetical protein Hanom_Chr01g00025591 [Helianthus anomalus]